MVASDGRDAQARTLLFPVSATMCREEHNDSLEYGTRHLRRHRGVRRMRNALGRSPLIRTSAHCAVQVNMLVENTEACSG
jgi:hypothetical protein